VDKSPNQIRNLAIKRTGISLLMNLIPLALAILLVVLVIKYPQGVLNTLGVIFVTSVLIAFFCAGYIWVRSTYKRNLAEINGTSGTPTGWKKNTGTQPCSSLVNVQLKDGTVCWRVKAEDKDWSLTADNPIMEYRDFKKGHGK
jgi:hypothetical protein